jgi:hypothetical protein
MSMAFDPPSASPAVLDRLCDGLKRVFDSVGDRLPLLGLGVLQCDGAERAVLNYVDATGTTAHRIRQADLPDAVRPGISVPGRLETGMEGRPSLGVLGARVLLEGMPAVVRDRLPVTQAVAFPIPLPATPATLIVGLSTTGDPTDSQLATIGLLARDVADLMNRPETAGDELARLRRLDAIEGVLPALISVLDIRQIFMKLSDATRDGLPHDLLSVGTFSDDVTEVYTYASAGAGIPEKGPVLYPREAIEAFLYQVLDDMPASPGSGRRCDSPCGSTTRSWRC